MFIHFINDIKFVDSIIDQFEIVDPKNHKYIFILTELIDRIILKINCR